MITQIGRLIILLFGAALVINAFASYYRQIRSSFSYFSETSKNLTDYVVLALSEYRALPWALDEIMREGKEVTEGLIIEVGNEEEEKNERMIVTRRMEVTADILQGMGENTQHNYANLVYSDITDQCISMERIIPGFEISLSKRTDDGNEYIFFQGDRNISLEKLGELEEEDLLSESLMAVPYEHHDERYQYPEVHNYWFEGMEGEEPKEEYEWIYDTATDPEMPLKLYVYSPIVMEGETVAIVTGERAWSRAEIREMLFNMLRDVLNSGVYLAFCAFALLFSIYFLTIRPLARFQSAVQTYKDDKDTDRVVENLAEIQSRNEIGRLSTDVSDMAVTLHQYSEDLLSVTAEKERIGAELDVAAQIQSDILPKIYPGMPAFDNQDSFSIFASMHPAKEVGGDLFDFFLIDEDHLAMVIGDVSGKGVPAALFMAITTSLIRHELQENERTVTQVLHSVNNCLCEGNEQMMFVTIWAAVLELSTGILTTANGGHDYPMIRRNGGRFALAEENGGIALGVVENSEYHENTFQLEPGDTVYVYTDGFPEAMNLRKEQFGMERMLDALNEEPDAFPEDLERKMQERAAAFVGESEQFDDMTMLCVKYLKRK